MQKGRIKVGDIAEIINSELPVKEHRSNRYVSGLCQRLGFLKTYIHGRVAIRYDQSLIDRLKTDPRYKACFSDTPLPPDTSPNLIISPRIEDWDEVFPN